SRGQPETCLEHALRVLVDAPLFDAALRELAADVDGLRARLDAAISDGREIDPGSARVLVESFAAALPSRHALALRLVDALWASPMLARCGIDAVELSQVLVQGAPPLDVARTVPPHVALDVVVHG